MSIEPRAQQVAAPSDGAEGMFVGRRRELKALAASLDAARSGKGHLDVVTGAPGIGKTRLGREVAALASQRGLRVLRGGCWEGEGALAYWPWANVLRSALDAVPDDRASTAADFSLLLEAAAARARVPPANPVDVAQDAQQARFVLFDRFCEVLAATAAEQPTLVVIDDVHWADAGSLLLLQFLAERLADLPLALLITSREPLSDMTAALTRHAWTRHLALSGLSRTEAGTLIEARIAHPPAREVLDRLMQLTEGNPYFLRELGSLLIDGTPDFDPTGSVALPTSLMVVALQPYHRLSPACRSLLQAAAVIGREFTADLAASATGIAVREALALLDRAVERQVVVGLGSARYRFAHALLREAIREQLHLSDRTHLHERIALALERRLAAGERVASATLAHHCCMGLPLTDRRRAATHAIAAAQEAQRACAFEEAVFQLRRALELSGPTLSDNECCDLMLLLGAAEAGAGEWARSRRTFEDAAALARRIDSPDRLARAALGFKGMMLATIPVDIEAVTLLREAQERLGDSHPELSVEIYASLSLSLYFSDDTHLVHHYSDLAMNLAHSLKSDRLVAVALYARTMANLRPHGASIVRRDAEELLRLGLRLHDPMVSFQARICRYWTLLAVGNAHEAAEELARATELASKTRHPRPLWQVALLEASQAIARGQFASSAHLTSRARELGRRVHDSSPIQHTLIQSFQQARLTKEFAAWTTSPVQSVDRYRTSVGHIVAQAVVHAELGRIEESCAALSIFQSHHFKNIPKDGYYLYILGCLAQATVICASPEAATILYSILKPYQSLSIVAGWGTVIDGSVSHYLGILARCFGKLELARQHFEAALPANCALDAPPLLARTQLEYSRLCASQLTEGGRKRAHELSTAATRTFAQLGLDAYRTASEEVAAATATPRQVSTAIRPSSIAASHPKSTLIRKGDVWMLCFQGTTTHIRHRLGLQYIAYIIRAAGDPVHVIDLVANATHASHRGANTLCSASDDNARRAYKSRLQSIEDELELAVHNNDLGQIDRLRNEKAALIRELSYSYGLSGRPRPNISSAERARIGVKNRISAALAVIKLYHQPAFQHLSRSLVTGMYCRYSPTIEVDWAI